MLLGRWQFSLVAVKVLKEECTQHVSSSELANVRREAEMLQALSHPNILRFYGACFTCKPVRSRYFHGIKLSHYTLSSRLFCIMDSDMLAGCVQMLLVSEVRMLVLHSSHNACLSATFR